MRARTDSPAASRRAPELRIQYVKLNCEQTPTNGKANHNAGRRENFPWSRSAAPGVHKYCSLQRELWPKLDAKLSRAGLGSVQSVRMGLATA